MNSKSIGELVELQRGTTYKSALLEKPGPLLLGLGSIARDGGFRPEKLKTYGGPSPKKLLVYPGDLYVSLKDVTQSGDLLGSIARVPNDVQVGRMTQDTVKLCFKTDISKSYFYWALRTPQYRQHCRSHATGTTNLGLSRDDFFAFEIPELTEWATLVTALLEDIESKINTNSKINQTLEQIAQAIFKSWFVDFEPTRAKMAAIENGEDPERAAMAAISGKLLVELEKFSPDTQQQLRSTAALFPDSFGPDGLPKGWEMSTIGDVAETVGGATPKTREPSYWDGPHRWATPRDLSKLSQPVLFETDRTLTDAGLAKVSSGMSPAGTVLLSSRAPIGYVVIAQNPVAVNQGFIALRETDRISSVEAYFWVHANMNAILANANGSTFQEI